MAKNQVFFGNYTESLANFDHELFAWRTSQTSFDWAELMLLDRLPKSGMTVSGQLYVVEQTLELPTNESAGFVLPTPLASDAGVAAIMNNNTNIVFTSNGTPRKVSNNGVNGSLGLARTMMLLPQLSAVKQQTKQLKLPTPTCHDMKNNMSPSCWNREADLGVEIAKMEGYTSETIGNKKRIHPDFVAWMMGYPIDWLN
jgi:hypothetical protein